MKTITKKVAQFLLILFTVLFFSSCKKDTASKQTLIGKWPLVYQHIIAYNSNGSINNEYTTPYTGREYLEFFTDGHCFAYWEDTDKESFPYTYDEANQKLYFGTGSSAVIYQITKFTANELEITNRDATTKYEGKMKR